MESVEGWVERICRSRMRTAEHPRIETDELGTGRNCCEMGRTKLSLFPVAVSKGYQSLAPLCRKMINDSPRLYPAANVPFQKSDYVLPVFEGTYKIQSAPACLDTKFRVKWRDADSTKVSYCLKCSIALN